ncbi:Transamidase GatB domain protein [Acidisarcina polymorpha]|uniref:Transamidase GatB domain protein n=1 Tax=Acidisarcina polymorpha TaxID=2211140 RepID=A0A2Z5FY49_9BACT|nr:GatB/YqeY domain-containing protein [Acidisarcina polymorpha]AXC11315.1 Transamidase GatB domain protein [Acidisarcina polymorpha]
MSVVKQVDQDMIAAMKARDTERLLTIRMMKTAFKNKEIDKREPLTDAEAYQILTTMIKQRRDSIEQFTKGNRPDLAAKEAGEIALIEEYMPKAAGEDEIRRLVVSTIDDLAVSGFVPGPKDMGVVMKAVQERIKEAGVRADGKLVSEAVKACLAK